MAQQLERTSVKGVMVASSDEALEGIHVYNITSEKGTVTNEEGAFSINVASQDRLQITSIQYQSFTVVVTAAAIAEGTLKIYLNPYINTLDEVLLSPYNLTGDLEADAQRMEVVAVPDIELSYDADADFAPDRFSRIQGNAAQEALGYGNMANGLNIKGLVELLIKVIFPKKKKQPIQSVDPLEESLGMVRKLQTKYSGTYYTETFGIPAEKVDDFIYFAKENAVTKNMLEPGNEMELLKTLFEQSERYKARSNNE